ncbi:NAD(P)/FAD-dependent oxidoreductase [Halomarina oriensis]|uniref:FAD-dependent oxidoreductase n=1 Tax=Halomarina oriensis TaxID=671145 RepID=A0A6B0GQT7_9EURY|nr:NAD(P)/FAD-dependent oxidoreductase [Halomarina oriensis]MWG35959.1 FAD-dependent oxidoreductase [Halomarina oriensis]
MIGIVGGGIAGLAAAYRLQGAGHDVRVFEAGDDVGGLAATYPTNGDPIEQFYHHLSKSEETIVELAEELGVADRLEWRIGKNAYYVDGTVHPMDAPWEILSFPPLGLYDTFRLGLLTMDVDVRGGIPKFDSYERLEDFEDVTAREFVVEHTTENVYESFFEPLLDAKFGSRKEDVSAAWLLGRIKFRGERDLLRGEYLGYFDGGFPVLVDALVDAVGRENVTTGARVVDVVGVDGPATAGEEDGATAGPEAVDALTVETEYGVETHDVESVVVAAMPNVLESLVGYECDVDFQGSVCAVLTMDEPLTDTYWLNVGDDAPFGALIDHTNFVPASRYGGDHLLYVASYVQSLDEALWRMSDEELREHWLSGIEELFPRFDRSTVGEFRVGRNPRTAPVYECGYLDMVVPYDLREEVGEGVYYAGMASRAQYPERSLNGAIVAGYEVADRIVQKSERVVERPADD